MIYASLGIFFTPLDLLLQYFEKKKYQKAPDSTLPQIFVCGPPRSGTTLVTQVLIRHLPVYYFNNLTSIFPRSPITALKLFKPFVKNSNQKIDFRSFYGRTSRLGSPNDALYFWDRWFGKDRKKIPKTLADSKALEMKEFFNAVEDFSNQPVVCKNNSLNAYADLVAPVLKDAYFICLDRNPLYLAQSHLIARRFINADEKVGYGVEFDENQNGSLNHLEAICHQVDKHINMNRMQQEKIGSNRFIILPYEEFCANPAQFVSSIAKQCLNVTLDPVELAKELQPLKVANTRKLSEQEFQALEETYQNMKEKNT